MTNEISRIKDLTPIATVSDSDVFAYDGQNGTKGIAFEDLCSEILNRVAATPQEIQAYFYID